MSTDPRHRRDPLPERKSRLEMRWSVWLERWELDPGFRRMASAIIAMMTLAGVVMCFCGGVTLAQSITGVRLWSPTESPLSGVFGAPPASTYPVIRVSPVAGKPTGEPVFVATSEVGPPTPTSTPTPTVTPGPSPAPTVNGTLTPVPCPNLGPPSSPQGGTAKSSISPSPMIAGCVATLYLSAPAQKNAKVTISLIFGLPQPVCQVALTTQTDSSGKASVTFTVPSTACFHGSGRTTGMITIGEDSSAASDLPING